MAAAAASKAASNEPEKVEVKAKTVKVRLLSSSYHDGAESHYRGDVFDLDEAKATHLLQVERLGRDLPGAGLHGAVLADLDEAPADGNA